jgi:2'-5' RNA ligase
MYDYLTMTLAIPLYFDVKTESIIQSAWQELAEEGVAPYMFGSGIRPHLTLAIYRDIDHHACQTVLSSLIENLDTLKITFSYVGIFFTPAPVVFLAPTMTRELITLHETVNKLLDKVGDTPDPYYLPGQWVAHCTLAVEFDRGMVNRAVEIALKTALPLSGWAAELCLVEFPPYQDVFSLKMRGLGDSRLVNS